MLLHTSAWVFDGIQIYELSNAGGQLTTFILCQASHFFACVVDCIACKLGYLSAATSSAGRALCRNGI